MANWALAFRETEATIPNRRIIFFLHPFAAPSGGVAVIYRHAEILSEHGFRAFVALPSEPSVDFYESRAPLLIHHGKIVAERGDVFVIPEAAPRPVIDALKATGARLLMFCQNQYFLPFGADPRAGIAELGMDGFIASSTAVLDFFRDVYGVEGIPLIPCAVDSGLHAPAAHKRRQIAFMPRKQPHDAAFLLAVFRRRHVRYAGVPWIAIENKTRREAASVLAESDVFLSLSHKESFGLPPLEAMACGCLVAGYHGDGGREYMTPDNGWWAESGDWKACVDGLAAALDLLATGGHALEARRAAMEATVARYSPARMEDELLRFWHAELASAPRER